MSEICPIDRAELELIATTLGDVPCSSMGRRPSRVAMAPK